MRIEREHRPRPIVEPRHHIRTPVGDVAHLDRQSEVGEPIAGIASLKPRKRNGIAVGNTIFRRTVTRVPPMTRTILMWLRFTLWIPLTTFMKTMKNTNPPARMIFGAFPSPNHMIMSGASATFGIE